jgi:hypothetical protein
MKKLRCYLGVHRWQRLKNKAGDGWYRQCSDCGKFGDDDVTPPPASELTNLGGG